VSCPTLNELPAPTSGKTGWPWTEESTRPPDTMPDGQPWPRVSIVTPSYNQAQFIEETVRSVVLQGYPNLDYIVMDGGSADGSVDIIRRYAPWLASWVSQPDRGQSDAINQGWRHARGEIITWLNSDDTYRPDAIRTAVEFLVSHRDVALVYGGCNCVGPQGEFLGTAKAWPFDLKRQITSRNLVLQSSSFFRRSALDRVGELDVQLRYLMDYDLWLRMLREGYNFRHVPEILSNYRLHPGAKTVAERLPMSLELKVVIDRLFQDNTSFSSHWRARAYSSYYRSLGNVYYNSGQRDAARREFWRAVRFRPLRLTTVIVLAYLADTWLGTRMGPGLQRLRWRLPDAPEDDLLLGEGATQKWL
jgi:glycosyltransferase involved in cell wall biosynthesis